MSDRLRNLFGVAIAALLIVGVAVALSRAGGDDENEVSATETTRSEFGAPSSTPTSSTLATTSTTASTGTSTTLARGAQSGTTTSVPPRTTTTLAATTTTLAATTTTTPYTTTTTATQAGSGLTASQPGQAGVRAATQPRTGGISLIAPALVLLAGSVTLHRYTRAATRRP